MARPHALPHEVSAYIYIYFDFYVLIPSICVYFFA